MNVQLVVQAEVSGRAGVVVFLLEFLCTDLQTLPHLVGSVSIRQQFASTDQVLGYRLAVPQQCQVDVTRVETSG